MFWGNKNILIFNFSLFRVLTQLNFFFRFGPSDFYRVLPVDTTHRRDREFFTVKGDKSFRIEGRFKTKLTTKKN